MEWQIYGGAYTAPFNMALDEAVARRSAREDTGILRVYTFSQDGIVLPYRASINAVLDAQNIDVTRRESGGAPMWCDQHVIGYSVALPADRSEGFEAMHQKFGAYIADALESFGVNNIRVGDTYYLKIGTLPIVGNAHRKTAGPEGYHLYHGIIPLSHWDHREIDRRLQLRQFSEAHESDIIRALPALADYTSMPEEEMQEQLQRHIPLAITGSAKYENTDSELLEDAYALYEEKYGNRAWIQSHTEWEAGFCFTGHITEETVDAVLADIHQRNGF